MQQQTKILIGAAIGIIIILVAYLWFLGRPKNLSVTPNTTIPTNELQPRNDVKVVQAEATDTGKSLKLPTGFPTSIPVDLSNITESYSAFYEKHNSTQYTVGYMSTVSVGTKWDEYNAYMTKAGYTINKTASIRSKGTLLGTKSGESLSIVITTQKDKTIVNITLLKQS